MLKKVLSYILIVFGLAALYASTSRTAMRYISDKRDVDTWWGSYQGKHGDLIGMSYLELVKKLNSPPDLSPFPRPTYNGPKNVALYLQGDSYTRYLKDTVFAAISSYHFINRTSDYSYHLEANQKNILVMEVSERYLRDYYNSLQMIDRVHDSSATTNSTSQINTPSLVSARYASFLSITSIDDLFNKYINQNLQFNLFNYNFIRPIFESKAALNYYAFDRASGDVVISDKKDFLFLKETVTATGIRSSYAPLTDADIRLLVDNFNAIYDHYRGKGFKEVYLSIIPNAATIMQPKGYNNLIPLLQNDPRLKIKIIDAYSMVKKSGADLLIPGETHWNRTALRNWINMVNEQLIQQANVQ